MGSVNLYNVKLDVTVHPGAAVILLTTCTHTIRKLNNITSHIVIIQISVG